MDSTRQPLDVTALLAAYFSERPDVTVAAQRVAFGTSGHRGSAFDGSFNEWHVLAITQAICDYRRLQGIGGPLFLGLDTHALSGPAGASVLEVLAGNGVNVMLAPGDQTTPTPAVSLAIVNYNRAFAQEPEASGRADGIIVTPSYNPPRDGGIKYNPPHGGPAGKAITDAIQAAANGLLERDLVHLRRMPYQRALKASTTGRYDFAAHYVRQLDQVVDLKAIREAGVSMGVDPMGGAGVHYWQAIAEQWRLDLTVVNEIVDPAFGFMPPDWDGQIRMDPSSPCAMRGLIALKDRFDIAFACDTDHDRHGIVTPVRGLMPPNHYLCAAIDYLFRHRPGWAPNCAIGKTVVSTQMIDRVAQSLGRAVCEVPAGFKWFATGLRDAGLGFAGEESAGASFLRRDGSAWTTDKDGIAAALLSAEMTAVTGLDPAALYVRLTDQLGAPVASLVAARATPDQKQRLAALSRQQVAFAELAGERVESVITSAPGNGAAIAGIKVSAASGWFAARPSGTENIYKIYAESFRDEAHLAALQSEAQAMVDGAIASA